jgi:hypothetical protein
MLNTSKIRKYIHKRLLENASKFQIFDELNYKLNDHNRASQFVRNMPYTKNQKYIPFLNKTLAGLIVIEVLMKLLMFSEAAGTFTFYTTVDHLNLFTLSSAIMLFIYFKYDCFLYKLFFVLSALNLGTITIYDQYQGFWLYMDWSVLTVSMIIIGFILYWYYPQLLWKRLYRKKGKLLIY